ncbi:ArnT family glycosyltransferase [Halomicrobium salinisoli]|uniref:ArnT family glycosyltransferase n=1 Tax=Halomicrobium salinisoli TaxID=2878391 RepID=UPI001CF012A5|nr:glycosyltransferase family 39 protein [Halomicrobium salinisoli]
MDDISIEEIESVSNVDMQPTETVNEYLERLGSKANISEGNISETKSYFSKKKFTDASEITEVEYDAVCRFVENVEELSIEQNQKVTGSVDSSQSDVSDNRDIRNLDQSDPSTTSLPVETTLTESTDWVQFISRSNPALGKVKLTYSSPYEWLLEKFTEREIGFLTIILLLGGYIYYTDLGEYPVYQMDEGLYANAAEFALTEGFWFIPHHFWLHQGNEAFQPFLEKPPGAIWFEAISMAFFGVNEFAVRFPAATTTIITSLLVFQIARDKFDSEAGIFAALAFLTVPHIYAGSHAGRYGATDMLLVFFGSVFIYTLWKGTETDNSRWFLYSSLAGVGAVYVKSFAAAIYVFIALPLLISGFQTIVKRENISRIALGSSLLLPWPLIAWISYGDEFVHEILIEQVLNRATGSFGRTVAGGIFEFQRFPYFKLFPYLSDPWGYFAGAAVLYFLIARRDKYREIGFVTWWALFVICFYAYTGNHPWYLLPIYVPVAVLVGALLSDALQELEAGVVAAGAAIIIIMVSPRGIDLVAVPTGWLNAQPTSGPLYIIAILGLGVGVLTAPLWDELLERALTYKDDIQFAKLLFASLGIVLLVGILATPATLSSPQFTQGMAELGKSTNEAAGSGETVYLADDITAPKNGHPGRPMFSFAYYVNSDMEIVPLYKINQNSNISVAVVDGSQLDRIQRNHSIFEEVTTPNRGTLYVITFG